MVVEMTEVSGGYDGVGKAVWAGVAAAGVE